MEKDKLYVAEYSAEQKFFHLTTLENAISINKEMVESHFKRGIVMSGYIPFFIGTYDEADLAIDKMREIKNSNKHFKTSLALDSGLSQF